MSIIIESSNAYTDPSPPMPTESRTVVRSNCNNGSLMRSDSTLDLAACMILLEQEVMRIGSELNLSTSKDPIIKVVDTESFEFFLMKQDHFFKIKNTSPKLSIKYLSSIDKVSGQFTLKVEKEYFAEVGRACKNLHKVQQTSPVSGIQYMQDDKILFQLKTLLPIDLFFVHLETSKGELIIDFDFNPTHSLMLLMGHGNEFQKIYNTVTLTDSNRKKTNNYHCLLLPYSNQLENFGKAMRLVLRYYHLCLFEQVKDLLTFFPEVVLKTPLNIRFDRIEFYDDWFTPSYETAMQKSEYWISNTVEDFDQVRIRQRDGIDSITAFDGNKKKGNEEIYSAVCCHPKVKYITKFDSIIRVERRRFVGRVSYGNVSSLTFPNLNEPILVFSAKLFYRKLLYSALKHCCPHGAVEKLLSNRECLVSKGKEWIYFSNKGLYHLDELLISSAINRKNNQGRVAMRIRLKLQPNFRHFLSSEKLV